tara:strand:- start:260 stop:1402 length:1143 start_codon:yes stop_codon:yes gene_type:complete
MKKIAVLGNGVTAKAVKAYILRSKFFEEVNVKDADCIVTSPGIPPLGWPKASVEIISDIEFVFRIFKRKNISPKLIGITGTNGKTTVASALAHVLGIPAYGNIGVPLINDIDSFNNRSIIILELSSFQLKSSPTLICDIAVITNITEDHIDWHQSFEQYEQTKLSILKRQDQTVIIPKKYQLELKTVFQKNYNIEDLVGTHQWFSEKHNQKNMEIVEKVGQELGISKEKISQKISTFELPPFRCQVIQKGKEITIINDSKSTNMGSTLAAVNSYENVEMLILAGQPKSIFSDEWSAQIDKKCKTILLAGELANKQEFFPELLKPKLKLFPTLKLATEFALNELKNGLILFSPGAASFDEFENYIARGKAFNEYVSKFKTN